MPKMSYDMQQGTVVRWLKDEGEQIISGEVIAEIETDKATVEMPAYTNGVMGRIVVETGRSVPVGELIAIITQQGETLPPLDTQPAETPPRPPRPPSPPSLKRPYLCRRPPLHQPPVHLPMPRLGKCARRPLLVG